MKNFKSLLMILFACVALTACNSKEGTMNDLRQLKAEVSANSDNYTVEDWKKFLTEFQKADSLLNTYELTEEEKAEIRSLKNQCTKYVVKGSAKVAASEFKDALNGAVNDAVDGAANAVKGLLNGLTGEEDK